MNLKKRWTIGLQRYGKIKNNLDSFISERTEDIDSVLTEQLQREIFNKFTLYKPSFKQKQVFTWWKNESSVDNMMGIICDGSIRSGKTLCVSASFLNWSMSNFNNKNFALCGKTIGTFRRNIVKDFKSIAQNRGYSIKDKRAENCLIVSKDHITNYYYIFGGKDESSQDLIQGITLAGAYLDEVVLMPKSFVDQCLARCSVEGSKYWFTCNPGSPQHYFKTEFIDKAEEKNFLYLHFDMNDNPTLSEEKKKQYESLYTGVFYKRYILGMWVQAEGLIYQVTERNFIDVENIPKCEKYFIAGDYGTYNPMAWGFYGVLKDCVYKIAEYHHSGRETQNPKSDEEYADDFINWSSKLEEKYGKVKEIAFDPSAASFITSLRKRGKNVRKAKNAVKGQKDSIAGIPLVQSYYSLGKYIVCNDCIETKKEIYSYMWNDKRANAGEEEPIKENDHHMDSDRYFFNTFIGYKKVTSDKYRFI